MSPSRPDASKNVKAYKGVGHNIEIIVVRSGQAEKTVFMQFKNVEHPWDNKIIPHERIMVSPERVEYKTTINGEDWLTMLGQKSSGSWQYTVKLQGMTQEIPVSYSDKIGKDVDPQEVAAAYAEQEKNAPVVPQPEPPKRTETKVVVAETAKKQETQLLNLPEESASTAKPAKSAPAFVNTANLEDKNCEILLRMVDGIEANQDFTASEEKTFKNYFDFKLMLGNRGNVPNAVVDIKVSFFIDGKWAPGLIIPANGLPIPQNVAPGCAVVFRVTTAIQVRGLPGNNNQDRATSHPSLPDPLRIRLEFEMLRGDNNVREFEYRRK